MQLDAFIAEYACVEQKAEFSPTKSYFMTHKIDIVYGGNISFARKAANSSKVKTERKQGGKLKQKNLLKA